MKSTFIVSYALTCFALAASPVPAVEFPGPCPGEATAKLDDRALVLKNDVLSVSDNGTGTESVTHINSRPDPQVVTIEVTPSSGVRFDYQIEVGVN